MFQDDSDTRHSGLFSLVIPAQAGISCGRHMSLWAKILAFARMTRNREEYLFVAQDPGFHRGDECMTMGFGP